MDLTTPTKEDKVKNRFSLSHHKSNQLNKSSDSKTSLQIRKTVSYTQQKPAGRLRRDTLDSADLSPERVKNKNNVDILYNQYKGKTLGQQNAQIMSEARMRGQNKRNSIGTFG